MSTSLLDLVGDLLIKRNNPREIFSDPSRV